MNGSNNNTTRQLGGSRNAALTELEQGTRSKTGEILSYTLYDTYTFAAANVAYDFFTVPQGQAGKTKADSNNLLAGQFPSGQRMLINLIKVSIVADAGDASTTDLAAWYNTMFNTTVEFVIPGKDNLGLWTLTELFGYNSGISTALTQQGPEPRFTGVFRLGIPIILAAQTPFKLRMEHHAALTEYTDDWRLKIGLAGALQRLS